MSARHRTVFPAPFGPMIASEVPRSTRKLRSAKTRFAPNRIEMIDLEDRIDAHSRRSR